MTDKVHGNSKPTEIFLNGKLIKVVDSVAEAAEYAGISPAYVCILKRTQGETNSGFSFK